jgi:hypothetical protein
MTLSLNAKEARRLSRNNGFDKNSPNFPNWGHELIFNPLIVNNLAKNIRPYKFWKYTPKNANKFLNANPNYELYDGPKGYEFREKEIEEPEEPIEEPEEPIEEPEEKIIYDIGKEIAFLKAPLVKRRLITLEKALIYPNNSEPTEILPMTLEDFREAVTEIAEEIYILYPESNIELYNVTLYYTNNNPNDTNQYRTAHFSDFQSIERLQTKLDELNERSVGTDYYEDSKHDDLDNYQII